MKTQFSYQMRRKQIIALLISSLFLLSLQITFHFYKNQFSKSSENIENLTFAPTEKIQKSITPFNPNDLHIEDWQDLGFSEKQASTILKYKDLVGGNFISKEQLKKCYAISDEKFKELEAFILLENKESTEKSSHSKIAKNLNINGKFNPDKLSQQDWQNMGFSEKQAAAILKYKNYLGGSFVSKEKLKDCFIINDEQFSQMKPYLILPEKTPENFKAFAKTKKEIKYKNFDPNLLEIDDWKKLGFSDKQAQVIVNYRDKNLKGSFRSLEDFKSCFVISEEKFNDLKAYIILNPNNYKTTNSEKIIAKQETDFSKLDLNKITFKQLIEFGFDEKAAGIFIGFRKKLGGFMNTQQMLDTYNIDKDLMQKLINTCKFSTDDVQKYTLVEAPEEWLKNHPYFKYSADKIIFYRTTYPNDEKIWKFLKLKPEYETRMRWYTK
ncbi:helix-hairpin-helix domain-containing protein [Soonwooa sp.]|uniref:helix-hairpin-helix domain-containing protein n=1 Tax=Soonwooa sp. TaxID=1938592 RepID=UPI002896EF15|nr:helix-hairpin-helix domain-containing protein [Soonwooa sp.]